jgi:hypothetical protein
MKHLITFTLSLLTCTTSLAGGGTVGSDGHPAFAKVTALPELHEMSIYNTVVSKDLSLQAQDGSTVRLLTMDSKNAQTITALPPEKNADHKKCASMDAALMGALIDMTKDIQVVAGGGLSKKPLTPAEIKVIQSTPRCGIYTGLLSLVALGRLGASSGSSLELKSISLGAQDQAAVLILELSAGKQVYLKLDGRADSVRDVEDLVRLSATAAGSGQGLGVRFANAQSSSVLTPNDSQESCTYSAWRNVCRDETQFHCRNEYVSEAGHRNVHTQFIGKSVELTLLKADGGEVLKTQIHGGDFDSQKSDCLPGPLGTN